MKSVGIDIHKRNSYLTVMDGDGSIMKQAKIPSDKRSFEKFFDHIDSPCRIAMESTYSWQWAYDFLEEFDQIQDIKVAHPLKTKAIASARIKNDKLDSETLAYLERAGLIPCAYVPPREIRRQRDLIRYRASLVSTRTSVKNRVHAVLAKNGIPKPCSDIFGKKGMEFLRTVTLPDVHRLAVDGYLRLLGCLAELLKEIDEVIRIEASQHEDTALLMSIPGVGYFSALLIASEIGDVSRFPDGRHLCSYAGLVPSTLSSGGKTFHGRITKQGSKWLRWIMVQCALVAYRCDPALGAYYKRIAGKNGKQCAAVALARKMLRIVYYVLTQKKEYRSIPVGTNS